MLRAISHTVLAVLAGVLAAPAAAADGLPAVMLVTVDTLRADRLSCAGYRRSTSPNIDALLERGLRFSRARTVEPLTNPALCSMLTGLGPQQHGASRNGLRLQPGLESLPKILARNGWTTAAVVSNWTLKESISGLAEHFQDYREVFTRRRWFGMVNREATGEDVTDEALEWLAGHLRHRSGQPFLLWVHYVEPHAPYRFHPEFARRLGITDPDPGRSDRYDTEIAAVDAAIGRLLGWLAGHLNPEQTLLFFAGDHGESLGEHGYWGHGRNLHEPNLAIPMGMVWPGRIRPGTSDAPAVISDLAPTVLELLGLPVPAGLAGFSWARMFAGDEPPMDRGLCYQAHRGAVHGDHDSDQARSNGLLAVGFVRGERKEILRIKSNTHMLFDLASDPGELANLLVPSSEQSPELLRCLGTISEGLGALDRLSTGKLDDETVAALRALGYLDDED